MGGKLQASAFQDSGKSGGKRGHSTRPEHHSKSYADVMHGGGKHRTYNGNIREVS
jgi:hypothetical protein